MTSRAVSTIIPVYNAGQRLAGAIASALSQSAGQVIVVNDGSTDAIRQVVAPFRDRIHYVSQTRRGPAAARNKGVSAATGPFLAFLDADDGWPAGMLSDAVDALASNPATLGVHGLTQLQLRQGDRDIADSWRSFGDPWRCPHLGSVVLRSNVFRRMGGLDESLSEGEDFDFFVRLRERGVRLAESEHLMLYYRIHGGNLTFGKSGADRNTLIILKRALDRRRQKGQLVEDPGC